MCACLCLGRMLSVRASIVHYPLRVIPFLTVSSRNCTCCTVRQLLAAEGGLPEVVTKNDGVFSAVITVKDGEMLVDTGESRLAPPVPHPMAPYDAKELQ